MRTSQFNEWLRNRVTYQSRVAMGAIAGMLVAGLLGLLIEGGLLYLIFSSFYGTLMAVLMVGGIFAGLTFYVSLNGPRTYRPKRHKVRIDGKTQKIYVEPTIANGWNYAFGSIDSEQSILEWIFSLTLIIPRMFWTAWRLMYRVQDVDEIDVEECSRVLRVMLKKSERIEMQEIADRFRDMDIPATMRQLSLIDGVIFLSGESVGISLANRFQNDLEAWLAAQDPNATSDDDDDEFHGA